MDLFKNKVYMKDAVVAGVIFGTANYAYYGSIFGVEDLSANIYFNSMFQPVAELMGYPFVNCSLNSFYRKTAFAWCFIGTIVCAVALYFLSIPEHCATSSEMCW